MQLLCLRLKCAYCRDKSELNLILKRILFFVFNCLPIFMNEPSLYFYLKGALDKYNIIPQLFPKKVWIFIPLEVLAWVMTAC